MGSGLMINMQKTFSECLNASIATRNLKAQVLACQFVRRSLKNIMDLLKPKVRLIMVPLSSLVCRKCKWQIEKSTNTYLTGYSGCVCGVRLLSVSLKYFFNM